MIAFCIGSDCWLGEMCADLDLQMRRAEQSITDSANFITENLRGGSKKSTTIIKPRESKGENSREFRWLQKKDTVGLN